MKNIYLFPVFMIGALSLGLSDSTLPNSTDLNFTKGVEQSAGAKQDTTKVQYVREDEPKRKKAKTAKVKTTRVNFKREVQRASLTKQSDDGNFIDIIVMQSGQIVRNVEDLQLTGSNGNQVAGNSFVGFENFTPPFEGAVRFRASNKLGTASYDREVRFTVMEKGRWILKIEL